MSICTGIIFVVVELAVTEILSISIDLAIPIKKVVICPLVCFVWLL